MNRDRSILGIHIDDDFLNIVHLGQTANGLQVHNWTAEPLKAGVVRDGLIVDEQAVSQKIRNFIKGNQLKSCKAIMSLSCSTVRLKPAEFEVQTDEQLQKQVEDQVGKYVLFGGQEVIFDYCIFENATQSSNMLTVLQAVTTKQISNVCLVIARRAGIELVRIEPAVLPVMKLAYDKLPAESGSVSLLLALDSASADLSVFKNGIPKLCQNLTIGIKGLSQDKNGFIRLIDQMKPVLEFARSLAGSEQLTLRIAASTNYGKLASIADEIKQSLEDVTVEQIEQSEIAKQYDVQNSGWAGVPIFAFASALMAFGACEYDGQLNLISQESLTMQRTQKEMSLTAKAIAAVVLLSIAALVPLKMKVKSVEAALAEVEAKVTETIPMMQKITDLKKQIKLLKEKLSAYSETGKELIDIPWTKALQAIGDTVPEKVRIVDISTSDSGEFTLVGEALAENYVYRFAKKLQDDELIESVKVEEIEYDDSNTRSIIDYKIIGKIRLPQSEL